MGLAGWGETRVRLAGWGGLGLVGWDGRMDWGWRDGMGLAGWAGGMGRGCMVEWWLPHLP